MPLSEWTLALHSSVPESEGTDRTYIRGLLPLGVLNVITGGDRLGPWMTAHPGFNKIAFTRST
jgi:hypothetical protein